MNGEYKKCRQCGKLKPLEEMKKRKDRKSGIDSICKKCFSAKMKETRKKLKAEMESNANDKRHGTSYGYSIGCRCEKCTEATKIHMREYRRRQKNGNQG